MPSLNMCGITANNKVIQFGLAFWSKEKEPDYDWAMQCLLEVMADHNIDALISIVTDRELALIASIETHFPSSRHLLCRWHVNMNVLAKTKKHFPGSIKHDDGVYRRHPSFQSFSRTGIYCFLVRTSLSLRIMNFLRQCSESTHKRQ
jgi:hypothetical protein